MSEDANLEENKVFLKLTFKCGHSRNTYHKFRRNDSDSHWIGHEINCDECKDQREVVKKEVCEPK